jgi:hypothetical protein
MDIARNTKTWRNTFANVMPVGRALSVRINIVVTAPMIRFVLLPQSVCVLKENLAPDVF